MVEVNDVVVHRVGGDDQVADVLRIERDFDVERILNRPHRSDRVDRGAHAADPLREEPGVARVAALENGLDATPHLARRPRVADPPAVDLDVDAQVALDPSDRVDGDSGCHSPPS